MMQSTLQPSTTPFKIIHDENDFSISTKTAKSKGLKSSIKPPIGGKVSFENSTPSFGKGTTKHQPTHRKALSNLSTSQVNARMNTPGADLSKSSAKPNFQISIFNESSNTDLKKASSSSSSSTTCSAINKHAEKGYIPTEDEMICSGSEQPLDPYDDMMNRSNTNKLKIQPIVDCMLDGGLAAIERDLETLIAGFECENSVDEQDLFFSIDPMI